MLVDVSVKRTYVLSSFMERCFKAYILYCNICNCIEITLEDLFCFS